MVPKFAIHNKLIQHERQKNKKIPYIVLETRMLHIVSQNFYKIGLNPKVLELLLLTLVINF